MEKDVKNYMLDVDTQVTLLLKDQCTVVDSENTNPNTKNKDVVDGQDTALETHVKISKKHVNGKDLKLKEAENVNANGEEEMEENNKDVVVYLENAEEKDVELSEKDANGLENLSKQELLKEVATGKFMERTLKEKDVAQKQSNVKNFKEKEVAKNLCTHANGQVLKLKTQNSSVVENLLSNPIHVEELLSKNVADI